MRTTRREILESALKLFDLGVIALGFAAAAFITQQPGRDGGQWMERSVPLWHVGVLAGVLLAWGKGCSLCGIYQSRRTSRWCEEARDVLLANLLCGALLVPPVGAAEIWGITGKFFGVLVGTVTAGMLAGRMGVRELLRAQRRKGRNSRWLIVVGTNPKAVEWTGNVLKEPGFGYRLVGFVDEEWEGLVEFDRSGYPRVADFAGFTGLLRERAVDEVALALPLKSLYEQAERIVAACEEQGVTVRCPRRVFELRRMRARPGEEDEGLTVHAPALEGTAQALKRMLDVAAAGALLAVLAPILVLLALAIRWDSPGPVIFAQERMGRNRRRFRMYKFRTMAADAAERQAHVEHLNEAVGPVFKIREDPRVTRVGRLLRKTSLDELPQLVNVLLGDMSLVGPRPMSLRDYRGFREDWQRRRFSVRPGMTCLWQVEGRALVPFEKWMRLDMEYIDRWSLWLDLKILMRTIPAVLRGLGAV